MGPEQSGSGTATYSQTKAAAEWASPRPAVQCSASSVGVQTELQLACRQNLGWRAVRTSNSKCGKEALKKLHTVGSVPAAESDLHFV